MADATGFQVKNKQIDEHKQATDASATQMEKLTQSQAQIDKLVQSQQKMVAMMAALMSQSSGQLGRPPDPQYSATGDLTSYSQAPQPPDPPDFNQFGQRLSKFEFPKFDGTLLSEWFRRCDEFFYLHKTPPEMRVRVASSYMIGKALQWHTDYIRSNFGIFPPWLDYIMAISAKFGDDDAIPMHPVPFNPYYKNPYATPLLPAIQPRAPFSPYQNQNNQSHDNSPNTTSLLPPLETTKLLPYKPNFPPETNMEKSPMKLFCEEIQESGMRGLCMPSDGSYANGHHLESKKSQIFVVECDDEESFDDREPSEVTVEEIIDKSVDMIREEKPTPENESSPEVLPQILPSQFQVSLSSLEPGRRYHKESLSLVVVNDLSYDHGCVIGKTIGSVCVSELGQANSHDEEEFKGLNLGKPLENERLLSTVFLLGLNDISCWTQLLRQQIFPKSWRFKFKTESSVEAILLNTYKAVCLGVYNSSLEEKLELSGWKYKKQINQGHICSNGLCKELVYGIDKKKLLNVEDGTKKAKKLDHNLIALNLQICCCIGGVSKWLTFFGGDVVKRKHWLVNYLLSFKNPESYMQRGTVYDAENMRLLDTKDGIYKVVVIGEISHFHVTGFSTTGQKLLLVKEIYKMWYKEDSWLFMQIMLKGLCASGFEMETWTVKKSLEWLNKLIIAISLAQMFLDHVCKLQGTPQDMLSDRDPTFLIELFRVLRADLSSDTTYEFIFVQPHPVHFPFRLEETLFAVVMDINFQKKEELIPMSKVHLSQGQNNAATKALVQWKEHPPDQATWEFYQDFVAKHPAFHP